MCSQQTEILLNFKGEKTERKNMLWELLFVKLNRLFACHNYLTASCICYQLSVICYQLSVISYKLSVICYR